MSLPYALSTLRPTQFGVLVLQADETLETDLRRLIPPEVEVLVSRVPSGQALTTQSIAKMADEITGAAALFPRGARCAVTAYACTSAAAQLGPQKIRHLIHAGAAAQHITEPVSALIAACAALKISSIGLISPYSAKISDRLREVLASAGISTPRFASFEEPLEENVARICPGALRDGARDMGQDPICDAIFLSCTNLRTLDVIEEIEAILRKPVLSSNQVLAWHMLRLAGIEARAQTPGRLWQV
ncbi:MAG: Asp/Glu racemase [Pseudomonadota bacterium]